MPPPHMPASPAPAPVAHARRGDPATSRDAAASLSADRLRASQQEVLAILREYGPLTDTGIAVAAHAERVAQSPSGLRTRRAELVALGKVADSGRREQLPTGRNSIVWTVTPQGEAQ